MDDIYNFIKFIFYDWEKNEMKNRYNSVSHNYQKKVI